MQRNLYTDKIIADVPRETLRKLEIFSKLLARWNSKINLVSPADIEHLHHRHILDSLQLISHCNVLGVNSAIDIGTGGGFPGMVLAITTPHHWRLVESDQRKCAFLQIVSAELGLTNVTVCNQRIESFTERGDIITARALAPLKQLLAYAQKIMHENSICIFLKGQNWANELKIGSEDWAFQCEDFPSETVPDGRIIKIKNLKPRHPLK